MLEKFLGLEASKEGNFFLGAMSFHYHLNNQIQQSSWLDPSNCSSQSPPKWGLSGKKEKGGFPCVVYHPRIG